MDVQFEQKNSCKYCTISIEPAPEKKHCQLAIGLAKSSKSTVAYQLLEFFFRYKFHCESTFSHMSIEIHTDLLQKRFDLLRRIEMNIMEFCSHRRRNKLIFYSALCMPKPLHTINSDKSTFGAKKMSITVDYDVPECNIVE